MTWMIYALTVGSLAGMGAMAAERALRAIGRPGRVPWAVAPLVSLGLPAMAGLGWTGIRFPAPAPATVLAAAEMSPAGGIGAGALLVAAWVATASIALALVLVRTRRLYRLSRGWRRGSVAGVPVLVSPDTGPATFGMFRPAIVVPLWLFDLDTRSRRLAVLHEQEHRRAGDVALLNAMALLVALVPWHPLLWWHAARLHRAIELDCDARVIRRVPEPAGYGRMLIEAASRTIGTVPLAAGLGLGRPLLEQRIRLLLARRTTRGAVAAACVTPVVIALAAALPTPFRPAVAEPAGTVRSTYRYSGAPPDSVPEIRATGAARGRMGDTTSAAVMSVRELPAGGVLRRADPGDPPDGRRDGR